MILNILKRDGTKESFDENKIVEAIWKSVQIKYPNNMDLAHALSEKVLRRLEHMYESPTVEQVQDAVEDILMETGNYDIAKAYILHRALHAQIREFVDGYLEDKSWMVRENANSTYSLQSLDFHVSSRVISDYWLQRIYYKKNPKIATAHMDGAFHIHDLGILGPYCVGWDLKDLLISGFKGARGKISSNPAKHFRVALGQITNFFFTLQGEAAGAQAFSNFDTYMAPFIRYDKMDYGAVKQALQEFIFNMNVPTRVGFQTPFSNITLDLSVPEFMRNDRIIIGGAIKDGVYGDFQEEMNIFNEAFGDVMDEGDADGRAFTFPIPTINITKNFDWDSSTASKIFEMTSKYGIPYFANFVNSDMNPDDVRSMCCHLRLDNRELRKRGGGLFGANPLTGSVGVVTINMPRIGYISKNETEYFENLQKMMDLVKESLELKREWIEKLTERGLYPYSKYYLRGIKMPLGGYWHNHFSTIGLLGMNESVLNFMGVTIGDPEGLKFSEKVLDFMRERIMNYQEETGNLYNLEATPAEGASYRLAWEDKKKYPGITVANENETKKGAKPYYTNSTQLPVYYTDDLFEALKLQEPLQTKYTGGTVFHIWLEDSNPPARSVMSLIKKVTEKYRLPYYTITPTFSICPAHGYLPGEIWTCPQCGRETEVYSRVVGYLRPIEHWNAGKKQEFKQRRHFDKAIS
jgi:ribonucleoside-triphosphate reductase